MNKLLHLLVFAILISRCNTNGGSYKAILIYNNDKFILKGYDDKNEYTIDKQIGIVANKVKPNVMPSIHLRSNYLDKGTELFSSKEDKSVILVKRNDQIEVFLKEPSD
ncbi:hypothetical protein [Fredinandcohnia onubensis]|uniref:hypothetical protein n=1 Tax=Fredinandcohnia onubensis TaxID=1571209 RepID=UPI000C0BBE21|nr:hypothetical protein [Fredinandcohnia onubensis]